MSLAGIPTAEFDDKAKTGYKAAIAHTMSVPPIKVTISKVGRSKADIPGRPVSVMFSIGGYAVLPTAQMVTLSVVLKSPSFEALLNQQMACPYI